MEPESARNVEFALLWASSVVAVPAGATGSPSAGRALRLAALRRAAGVTMRQEHDEGDAAQGAHGGPPRVLDLLCAAQRATAAVVAGDLAHEVGTPLNVILGRATLGLRDVEDPEKLAHHLRVIVEQTHRMTGILRAALAVLRPTPPQLGHRISVQCLVARVIQHLAPLALDRGVTLVSVDVEPLVLCGDEPALELALVLLLAARVDVLSQNAILTVHATKAIPSPARGAPTLTMVQLRINDEGAPPVVPPLASREAVGVIPRYRDDGEPLPWLVCREVLRRHGGRLEVKSGAQGTSVQVFLPEGES